jgi:alpha-glucosidase
MTAEIVPPAFDGVVYQIYPRSFLDTSGDGVGDLAGITAKLDHLVWLGVDAVWLSPIYRSPMADFGYDVADHTDVDPVFGSLADADALIAAAHDRGLQVWLDYVPNHTSDQHPWFQASRSSRDDPKRDWYIWRDPAPDGGPPNNWTRAFADEPAWTHDETTGQYYLHQFLPQQPDVNWSNPDLREAMLDVLRFWMDRGIDGFRADVVHLIGKDPDYPDDAAELLGVGRAGHHHLPEVTAEHLRAIRQTLDAPPGAVMVGEINLPDAAQVAMYVGDDLLHLAFQFSLIHSPWTASDWRDIVRYVQQEFDAVGAWPTWVLGNHDNPRIATRVGRPGAARAAMVALLTLRGVPFLFAGDELGLEDAEVAPQQVVDPGGRDGVRAPIPWDGSTSHGWAGDPWLPWPPLPQMHNVEAQRADPGSMLHLTRRLLELRRSISALRTGSQEVLELDDDVLAFRRTDATGDCLVLINHTAETREVQVAGTWHVLLASDGARQNTEGSGSEVFSGRLAPDQAVVLGAAEA